MKKGAVMSLLLLLFFWLLALINQENDQIQGASLLGQNSVELINIVKLAMDHHILAKALVNQVYPHLEFKKDPSILWKT